MSNKMAIGIVIGACSAGAIAAGLFLEDPVFLACGGTMATSLIALSGSKKSACGGCNCRSARGRGGSGGGGSGGGEDDHVLATSATVTATVTSN